MTTTQSPSPENLSVFQPIHGELAAEIRMVREVIRQVKEIADEDEHSLKENLNLLEGLSLASTRLASLLKMDRQLTGKSDFTDTLNEALEELYAELRMSGKPDKEEY